MPIPRATGRRPAARGGTRRTGISNAGDAGSLILLRASVSAQARERLLTIAGSGAAAVVLTTTDGVHSVRAVVDIARQAAAPACRYGRLTVDWSVGAVSTATGRTLLSKTELRLLGALLEGGRDPVTAEELSRRVWPGTRTDAHGCPALTVYLCSLRRRLASIGAGSALRTERGVGFRLALG